MNLEKAKQIVKDLNNFIALTEECDVDTFEKKAIKEYAVHGSVSKVSDLFNEQGLKIGNKKVKPSDISKIVQSKPHVNELHVIVQKIFNSNKKRMPYS
ncbi:hypothetical protein [Bacillus halotolerans]|uniref:hypothetical protein n=1 Tax=Bacillus halotolerans TaxID=260554 RepID=UPI002DC0084A|nr:hypothetical protein [Bacillus halotolerans]MEC1648736.1 hypothetical protein [Bacillus halotolerans]